MTYYPEMPTSFAKRSQHDWANYQHEDFNIFYWLNKTIIEAHGVKI